jgi:hypothetical protein
MVKGLKGLCSVDFEVEKVSVPAVVYGHINTVVAGVPEKRDLDAVADAMIEFTNGAVGFGFHGVLLMPVGPLPRRPRAAGKLI